MRPINYLWLWLVVLATATSSCVNHKQLLLLTETAEGGYALEGYEEPISLPVLEVQSDDILMIRVNTLNDEASRPFNMMAGMGNNNNGGGGGGNNNNMLLLQGYSVDSSGYIDFPTVGRVQVGGMSLEGVRKVMVEALDPYLKNPAVNVKFLNFRYSIVGDIANAGTFTSISERVSLFEALASAGDLTPYADRQKVYVIREEDGVRTIALMDLQDTDFLKSPYYYLQQNDVIYIEPSEAKIATVADPVSRFIGFGSAFLSLVTFVLTIATR